MHREVTSLLTELLTDVAVDDPRERAHALLSYLLGTVVQQMVTPLAFPALAAEITLLCGMS
ncbi:hypothetical protein ABH920_009963 [Catenulispora sp. EB89]